MTEQFLSDAWIEQVRAVKAAHAGTPIDRPGLVVNATITDVPFGQGTIAAHSAHGPVIGWEPGHVPDAAFSITVDYHTAKAMVLDQTLDVLDQAVTAGRLKVEGDGTAFREWWGSRIGNPDAVLLDDQVRAITA